MKLDVPKVIRASIELALMHAYYSYVHKCTVVGLDLDLGTEPPWAALGRTKKHIWVADFSGVYEYPAHEFAGGTPCHIRSLVLPSTLATSEAMIRRALGL